MDTKRLRTATLVGIIFFSVSGGPYGLEELIGGSGAGLAFVALLTIPIGFAIPCAMMSAELGSAMPSEGGYYVWVRTAMGPFAGFTVGIWQWFNSFLDTALYPVVFADYVAQWVPGAERGRHAWLTLFGGGLSIDLHWLIAIGFMVPLAWLNVRGSRLVGDTSVTLMVLILAPFVILSILGIARAIGHGTLGGLPVVAPHVHPLSAFGAGLGVVIWNYIGWDSPSTVLEEVDQPQRTYGRALAIAVPFIVVSYLLPVLGALGSGLHAHHITAWTDGDFAAAGNLLGGPWLKAAITAGAVLSQVGLFSSLLMSGSRVPKVLAADRLLPPALARDGRHGTPVVAIAVSCVIFAVFCSMDFSALIDADIVTNLAAIMLEFAALLVLRRTRPAMPRPYRAPGGWAGAWLITLGPALLTVYMMIATWRDEPAALWVGVVLLAVGVALYPVSRRVFAAGSADRV